MILPFPLEETQNGFGLYSGGGRADVRQITPELFSIGWTHQAAGGAAEEADDGVDRQRDPLDVEADQRIRP
jgi:hypothetical protein